MGAYNSARYLDAYRPAGFKFDPHQPRHPGGSPRGGQFARAGGSGPIFLRSHEERMLRDVAAFGATHDAERLYLSNSDGSQTEQADGEALARQDIGGHIEGGVNLSQTQQRSVTSFDQVTVIHNHPAMVTFSTGDIAQFGELLNFNRAHIVLADGVTVHSIVRPPGSAWDRRVAADVIRRYTEARFDSDGNLRWPEATRYERHGRAMVEAIEDAGLWFGESNLGTADMV